MAIKTFNPPTGPSFDFTVTGDRPYESTEAIKGYVQRRPAGIWELRIATLLWKSLGRSELDYILSFFQTLKNTSGYAADAPFYWTPPKTVMSPEGDSPELDTVDGGSLSIPRTYWVGYSWYNNDLSQETTMCPSTSITINTANKLCRVTLPIRPSGTTRSRIYATSGAQGTEKLEAAPTGRTWTEPVTGLLGTGVSPPSSNNLKPPIKWILLGKQLPRPMFSAARWRFGPVNFLEQWI